VKNIFQQENILRQAGIEGL